MSSRVIRIGFLTAAMLGVLACSRPEGAETTGFIVDGLQVIFKDTPGNPLVVEGFYLRGGANYMGEQQAGTELFLFETAIRGTKSLAKNELNSRLESMGIRFQVMAGYDYTGLVLQCPNNYFDPSWNLFTDVILNPRFDPDDLDVVRQKIISAIESEHDQPEHHVFRIANDLFYDEHPYEGSVLGPASKAAGMSRNDLLQYHRSDVTKNRALLVIVGDLDLRDVTSKARELARYLPLGPELRLPTLAFDPGKSDLKVVARRLPTNYITGFIAAPRLGHPDYPAFTVAMCILSDRLGHELRTRTGPAFNYEAGSEHRIANLGYINVTTARPDSAVMAIFSIVDHMTIEPVLEKQLRNALTTSVTRYLLENESLEDQLAQLVSWEIVGEGWERADQYLPEIRALRPVDIQSVARKYLRNFHFGVVGNPRRISRQLFTSR